MTSSYLLPGERDPSSSVVHTHGSLLKRRSLSLKQNAGASFTSVPRIYHPANNDFVIGTVIVRTPDLFLIDINSCESAILPVTSFDEGRLPARNTMNRLSIVCAWVVRTDPWTQTELSCQSIDRSKKKSEFGLITDGCILRCSLVLCDKLKHSPLINRLGSFVKQFRIRVGQNGVIWYTTETMNSMIAVKNVLLAHEFDDDVERLTRLYQTLMDQLQLQDNNVVQAKQQKQQQQQPLPVKKEPEMKKAEPAPVSNAVSRLLDTVIKSILDKIITDIEKSEGQ